MRTFAQIQKPIQQTKSATSVKPAPSFSGQNHEISSILPLDRAIGSHRMQRLLPPNAEEFKADSAPTVSTHFLHDFSQIPLHPSADTKIQQKLTVSAPGDMYEQEADHIADQVLCMPEPQLQRACPCGGGCPKCLTKQPGQEHESLQAKHIQASDTGQSAAPPNVQEVLAAPGQPLDPVTRGFMEPRFGHNFSQVRIHTDTRAAVSAELVGARAYTVGRDVVFGAGEYTPETATGRRLLAHELAHVAQQEAVHDKSSRSHILLREPATPEPSVEDRLTKLEKAQKATQVDLKWRSIFGRQLSSYREAIWRITGGLDEAKTHFEDAKIDQTELDTLVTQLLIAATAIGVATGFQPLFTWAAAPTLGEAVTTVSDLIENPLVQVVGSSADLIGPIGDVRESSTPPTPPQVRESSTPPTPPQVLSGTPIGSSQNAIAGLSSRPVTYLSDNMQMIERYQQRIETAFERRAQTLLSPTDDQMQNFDPAAREAKYSELLDRMRQACHGVEDMKSKEDVAKILERHLWALWIRQRNYHTVTERRTTDKTVLLVYGVPDLGSYIATALNNVGFGSTVLPEVQLGTHWYENHKPDNWADLLRNWAGTYAESIAL